MRSLTIRVGGQDRESKHRGLECSVEMSESTCLCGSDGLFQRMVASTQEADAGG